MKIIDISKCNEEVISYINELQNKYAELDKLNKELDKSNITIFEENNYLIKENKKLNNIINELEKFLIQLNTKIKEITNVPFDIKEIMEQLDKLQELKGSESKGEVKNGYNGETFGIV